MAPSGNAAHGHLPGTIDPIQLAERGAHLVGTLSLKNMPRLVQGSLNGSSDVRVDLTFERQEGQNVYIMHGTLGVSLQVICQRCLEPMELPLTASPWLILVKSGEPLVEPERETEVLVADKPIPLQEVVEQELLLALPMVPMHDPERCPVKVKPVGSSNPETSSRPREQTNPFSILRQLKKAK